MTEEIQYLMDALQGKFGWLIAITAWQTCIRSVMVFCNNKLKEFMETAVPEDRDWIQAVFNHRAYRLAYFLTNALLSVKLPTQGRRISEQKDTKETKETK